MQRKCCAHRTAVFAAVSEWNKPEKQMRSTNAFRKALVNKLTVEYITHEVGLLSIRRLLRPALRPFFKYFVRDGMFGMIFQSIKKNILFNESRSADKCAGLAGFAPIYPGVTNAIRELFLLSPQNRTRKVGLYMGRFGGFFFSKTRIRS